MDGLSILILAPIAFFVLLFLHGTAQWRDEAQGRDWRYAFLISAVVWGALVAVSSELLSLIHGLGRAGIGLFWASALLALFVGSDRFRRVPAGLEYLRAELRGLESWEWAVLGGLAAVGGLLLAVAWVSPPNNVDSLLYHMARVVHWAQNRSIEHYPAVFHHQLHMPPFAETAILHLRVLWGSDRPASLVQWFSYIASTIGVAAVAAELRVGHKGQILASAFTATVPMAALQATSTQNDLVLTFWVVCAAYFALRNAESSMGGLDSWAFAASFGLGALTKATFLAYGPPFLALFAYYRWRNGGIRRASIGVAFVLGVTVILNAGYWGRNLTTFGGPFGSPGFVRENLTSLRQSERNGSSSRIVRMGEDVIAREARAAGRNLIFPVGRLNDVVRGAMAALPGIFDSAYLESHRSAAWNHEDTAGNPLHFAAGLFTVAAIAAVPGTRSEGDRVLAFALATIVGILAVPLIISHGDSIWSVRFQLPFFMLWGPIFAVVVESLSWPSWMLSAGLLLIALPYIVLNNTRPVIGMPPWPTRTESVFTSRRVELLLAVAPHVVDEYTGAASTLQDSGCDEVALGIGSRDLEYAFWWLLDAPQSGVRIEVINPSAETARYMDSDFEACAVLCTRCQDVQGLLSQMGSAGEYDNYDLYLSDGEQ